LICPLAPRTESYDTRIAGSGTYTYDGNGLRVKRVSGSTTTVYIFSGSKVIAEYVNGAAPGSPTREYIYSGTGLLAKIEGGVTNYYQADHLSNRVTTDTNGNIVGQQGHYPFGESWYLTNTTTKWQFTSYERDAESGNDYAMARYDVNRLGRFSSPDPLAGSVGDPQSLNRYAYVGNDPLSNVDPLGLAWCRLDGVYIPCFVTAAMLRSGAVGLCPAGDDDCRKVRTGPNGQWQVCLREPCGNSDMSRWQNVEFVLLSLPPQSAPTPQQGGNSGGGGDIPQMSAAPPLPPPCRITDPILGALEFTGKLGPELQLGPVKAGFSLYKNFTTGDTGGKAELSAGLFHAQADNPTPMGGSLGGGSEGNQYSASFLGFQYNFNTGSLKFSPSKSFTVGLQALAGGEVSFNSDTFNQQSAANDACRAQGGR
jgi:RHS repeat-associated protein